MNNEEKILTMLEGLTDTVTRLDGSVSEIKTELRVVNERLDILEQGQAKLEQGQAKLEQGQAKLEQGQAEIRAQQLKDSKLLRATFDQVVILTEFKTETEARFDKLKNL